MSLVSRKKENRRIQPSQAPIYLWSGRIYWLNPSSSTSNTVSPPLGYQMCLAQFGMRHTQINILPPGATLESPRWVSKKNILSFILLSSHGCLDVVYVLAPDSYSCLWPRYNVPKFLYLRKEFRQIHVWYFSQMNSNVSCMQRLFWTGTT